MRNKPFGRSFRVGLAVLAGVMIGSIAMAQDPAGPPPGGPGGFPGGQGPMGMRRGGPPVNLARIPAKVLAKVLDLSSDQKTKIADIQKTLPQRGPGGPGGGPGFGGPGGGPDGGGPGGPPPDGGGPGGPPDGGPGGPPPGGPDGGGPGFGGPGGGGPMGRTSPEEQKAIKDIKAILTDDQNKKVPQILDDIRGIGPAGLPMPALEKVDLSKDQWSKIHAILVANRPTPPSSSDNSGEPPARPNFREIHEKGFAVLTDDQKKIAQEFMQRRGPGGPGGPGGFGGPGGGGPGGGGPDGDGF